MIPCLLASASAPPPTYAVNNTKNELQWISKDRFCNGVSDCRNNADEMYCNLNSEANHLTSQSSIYAPTESFSMNFTAGLDLDEQTMSCFRFQSNNFWTPKLARPCDGKPECFSLEDECDVHCIPQPQFCNFRTFSRSFNCPSNFILPGKKICNGENDCTEGFDEKFCANRFYCHSGPVISVEIGKVCDFEPDCRDASDEMNCSKTHFYCENEKPIFVKRQKVMDGIVDCSDRSDECPKESFGNVIFSSQSQMIKNPFLQGMVWVMGVFAMFGNLIVIVHGIIFFKSYAQNKFTKIAFVYTVLICNLAVADFLMGIFLLHLGVQNVVWSGSYCFKDREWRSGMKCNMLGVLVTLSAEVSLTSLALLSSYRAHCVLKPIKSRSFRIRTVLVSVVITWIIGSLIAFLPLYHPLVDYFLTHVWLKNNPYFMHDIIDKTSLQKFCQGFFTYDDGWAKNGHSTVSSACSNWDDLINFVSSANLSKDGVNGVFGYYGKHSTCLPKMFITREETSWEFSFGVTIFNFVVCIYVAIVYMIICLRKPKSKSSLTLRQTKLLQTRITLLIGSDCACWIPICFVAFLTASGYFVSDGVYAFTAIILLPINSSANPFFQPSTLKCVHSAIAFIRKNCRHPSRLKAAACSCKNSETPVNATQSNPHDFKTFVAAEDGTEQSFMITTVQSESQV